MGASESRPSSRKAKNGTHKKQKRQGEAQNIEKSYTTLMQYVHDNVIGDGVIFDGPYGKRSVVYCDYTASGRPLRCIEDYISKYVYQYYANTHTTTCITAQQTTQFRHDAKMMIKRAVNASDDDVVIFTGSGTTGAIHKMIGVLELKEHANNLVVFISPFEHHSNQLPWEECGAEVIRIQELKKGTLDIECLERHLMQGRSEGKRMIASFSAASNITGIMTDTVAVSELCHKYGALSFWDYATAAPYLEINMNASETGFKDAVFCSPHKFVGGPGTPGILIAKKSLFQNTVPHGAGGGTVLYVTKEKHVYVDDIESREEGGTPAIIESIRAGLCFQLKQNIGAKAIEEREEMLYKKARSIWTKLPNMIILGSGAVQRLPIFSFIVRYINGSTKYLHHNFLAILLNDMFGIQARGGCACAGPYAEGLLGINGKDFTIFLGSDNQSDPNSKGIPAQVQKIIQRLEKMSCNTNEAEEVGTTDQSRCSNETCTTDIGSQKPTHLEIMKPGFVRLNLPYFMNTAELDYIISAVAMLSEHAWKMLPLYKFDARTGEWKHRTHVNDIMQLSDVSFADRKMILINHPRKPEVMKMDKKYFNECLHVAQQIFDRAPFLCKDANTSRDEKMEDLLPGDKAEFSWFVEPWQAAVDIALINTEYTAEVISMGGKKEGKKLFNPRQMSVIHSGQSTTRRFVNSVRRASSRSSSKFRSQASYALRARTPLIKFRYPKGALEKSSSQSSQPQAAVPALPTSKPVQATSFELPSSRFRRRPIEEHEMEYIQRGGPE